MGKRLKVIAHIGGLGWKFGVILTVEWLLQCARELKRMMVEFFIGAHIKLCAKVRNTAGDVRKKMDLSDGRVNFLKRT